MPQSSRSRNDRLLGLIYKFDLCHAQHAFGLVLKSTKLRTVGIFSMGERVPNTFRARYLRINHAEQKSLKQACVFGMYDEMGFSFQIAYIKTIKESNLGQ